METKLAYCTCNNSQGMLLLKVCCASFGAGCQSDKGTMRPSVPFHAALLALLDLPGFFQNPGWLVL